MQKIAIQYTIELHFEIPDDVDVNELENEDLEQLIEEKYPKYPTGFNYNLAVHR